MDAGMRAYAHKDRLSISFARDRIFPPAVIGLYHSSERSRTVPTHCKIRLFRAPTRATYSHLSSVLRSSKHDSASSDKHIELPRFHLHWTAATSIGPNFQLCVKSFPESLSTVSWRLDGHWTRCEQGAFCVGLSELRARAVHAVYHAGKMASLSFYIIGAFKTQQQSFVTIPDR